MMSCGNASDSGDTQIPSTENQAPTADFTYTPSNPEASENVSFDASNSNDLDGSIVEYRWDFNGDGSNDAVTENASTSHMYSGTGDFDARLEVIDGDNATGEKTKTITVVDGNQAPEASFSFSPSNPSTGEAVTFDASKSNDTDGSVVSYKWDFTGNSSYNEESSNPTITHSYSSSGNYDVTLQIIDNEDATAEATESIQISGNQAPTASFSYSPSNPLQGETVTFDGSSSSDQDGTITEYHWDFDGDGNNEAIKISPTVNYSYSKAGDYDVRLQVIDNEGAASKNTKTVSVESDAPNASFTYSPSNPSAGETVTLDGSDSSDPNGSIVTYKWDFNGDGSYEAMNTSPTVNHSFSNSGDYDVTLEVIDNDDNTDKLTKTLTVGN